MVIIYLTTGSEENPKVIAAKDCLTKCSFKYDLLLQSVDSKPEQPINSGEECCWARIEHLMKNLKDMPRLIISVENEIVDYDENNQVYDRCWVIIYDTVKNIKYTNNSDPYRLCIPRKYLNQAIKYHLTNVDKGTEPVNYERNGISTTVGSIIVQDQQYSYLPKNNWMKGFGYDRVVQISDTFMPILQEAYQNL